MFKKLLKYHMMNYKAKIPPLFMKKKTPNECVLKT